MAVFVFNLALPLFFGWSMTEESGRIGMSAAVVLLLLLGCRLCVGARNFGMALVVGGVLVGLTQAFPLLQIVAGMVGMGIGQAVGQVETTHEGVPGAVSSEPGGFLVTVTTGGLLMAVSAGLGLMLRALTPRHWWDGLARTDDT